jgi:hypothetical protein
MTTKHNSTKLARAASAEHHAILPALERYRRVWQQAAAGQTLLDVAVPVGLVLAEIADALGLSDQERRAVLGTGLDRAVAKFAENRVQLKQ